MGYIEDARVFRAFCDESRLKILGMLIEGEKCGCVLLEKLDISQPTLSYHMKILCESGIVTGRQSGKWTHYSLDDAGCASALDRLKELTQKLPLGENQPCCEACERN